MNYILYFFILFYFIFYCCSSTVVSIPPFPPPTSHPQFPALIPFPPLVLSMCPLQQFLKTLPPCPLLSLPTSPMVTVSLFLISMSLIIFHLFVCFVDQVPLIGEIIWYLSFTAWLISLSIMLSSSIHAKQRVGFPSFFLLHSIPSCECTIVF